MIYCSYLRILSLAFVLFVPLDAYQKAIVIVPVADLVGQPMRQFYPHQSPKHAYTTLPWAQCKSDYEACPRLHQLLYHEIVDIIRLNGDEVEISIPQVFYQTFKNNNPQDLYWTLTKNIIRLDPNKQDLTKLPSAISYKDYQTVRQPNVITLIEPFYESTSGLTFSAGTRFVKTSDFLKNNNQEVYLLDPKTHSIRTISIPISLLYDGEKSQNHNKDFIDLLRHWAVRIDGNIPYVWGGCSFTQTVNNNQFKRQEKDINEKKLGYYDRPDKKIYPKTGFDCSSIIMRAAQAVGLPYFYKNTYTITQQLPLLQQKEKLKEGDLVWIRGHIFVVADLKTNTLFEAHAYDGGYGNVHEIPINKVFKGMHTLTDLVNAYRMHKPVERLNDKGQVFADYKEVKIFRFFR